MERALGPRMLCFVKADGVVLRNVEDHERDTQFVFIGYTAEQFNHDSEADMDALDAIALRAAQEAGVAAYGSEAAACPATKPSSSTMSIASAM